MLVYQGKNVGKKQRTSDFN